MGCRWVSQPSSAPALLLFLLLLLSPASTSAVPGLDHDYGAPQRFVCTPVPVDADPACFPPAGPVAGGPGGSGPEPRGSPGGGASGLWGMTEEAKATILHLRESLVQQKETILDQRETIRELTAKLTMCEGLGRGMEAHDDHYGNPSHPSSSPPSSPSPRHTAPGSRRPNADNGRRGGDNSVPDAPYFLRHSDRGVGGSRGKDKHATPGAVTSSPEQMSRMLETLKDRLENLQQSRNLSTSYSSSLKELLQRKINALEQQKHHRTTAALSGPDHHHHHDNGTHHDDGHQDDHLNNREDRHDDDDDGHHEDYDDHDDHNDINETDSHDFLPRMGVRAPGPQAGLHSHKLESVLNHLNRPGSGRKKAQGPDAFQISFPMRTNYKYGRVKRTLVQEIFSFTLCLWMKGDAGPGLGTPFSYSVPGQANELVLIEWDNNPMELLVDDQAVTLPLSLSDGKWHHVCVTWSTRDGQWEAYQDGMKRGSGEDLSAWHPIRPGGVFILGQEQDTLGGRFDSTQSFVGSMSDLHMWSSVLTANDIYGLASCGSHLSGDVFAWSETAVELHGGVTKYPFDPCH